MPNLVNISYSPKSCIHSFNDLLLLFYYYKYEQQVEPDAAKKKYPFESLRVAFIILLSFHLLKTGEQIMYFLSD